MYVLLSHSPAFSRTDTNTTPKQKLKALLGKNVLLDSAFDAIHG